MQLRVLSSYHLTHQSALSSSTAVNPSSLATSLTVEIIYQVQELVILAPDPYRDPRILPTGYLVPATFMRIVAVAEVRGPSPAASWRETDGGNGGPAIATHRARNVSVTAPRRYVLSWSTSDVMTIPCSRKL